MHFNEAVGHSFERGMGVTPPDRKGKGSNNDGDAGGRRRADSFAGGRRSADSFASGGSRAGYGGSHLTAAAPANDEHDRYGECKYDNDYESETERKLVRAFMHSHRSMVRRDGRSWSPNQLHGAATLPAPAPAPAPAAGRHDLSSPMAPSDDTFAHIVLGRSMVGRRLDDTSQPDDGNGDDGNEDDWYLTNWDLSD